MIFEEAAGISQFKAKKATRRAAAGARRAEPAAAVRHRRRSRKPAAQRPHRRPARHADIANAPSGCSSCAPKSAWSIGGRSRSRLPPARRSWPSCSAASTSCSALAGAGRSERPGLGAQARGEHPAAARNRSGGLGHARANCRSPGDRGKPAGTPASTCSKKSTRIREQLAAMSTRDGVARRPVPRRGSRSFAPQKRSWPRPTPQRREHVASRRAIAARIRIELRAALEQIRLQLAESRANRRVAGATQLDSNRVAACGGRSRASNSHRKRLAELAQQRDAQADELSQTRAGRSRMRSSSRVAPGVASRGRTATRRTCAANWLAPTSSTANWKPADADPRADRRALRAGTAAGRA